MSDGRKDDNAKLRYDLIPPLALRDVAAVLTFGATKYGDDNWRRVAGLEARYVAAAMRHLEAHRMGEMTDSETGLPHLAHAVASLMFVTEFKRSVEGYPV